MGYEVEYGPVDQRKRVAGLKLAQVFPEVRRLEAEGHPNVQIIGPDGEVADRHLTELNIECGGVRVD